MLVPVKQEHGMILVLSLFNAVGKPVNIEYIDLPQHLAEKYQYFTEANLIKNKKRGYKQPTTSLKMA